MTQDITTFEGKFIVLGFGSLGPNTVALLNKYFPDNKVVLISDMQVESSAHPDIAGWLKIERVVDVRLTPDNYVGVLATHITAGDFVVNLTVDVSCPDLIYWCQLNNVLYTDTALYDWPSDKASATNYAMRQKTIRAHQPGKSTALIAHGANPGLVNHFVKYAIDRHNASVDKTYAHRAQEMGIQTIQISEVDTQWSPDVRQYPNDFINTWSVQGFINEAALPAELTVGSHDELIPDLGNVRHDGSAEFFAPGCRVTAQGWNPATGPYLGMMITHNESLSLGQFLSTDDYRPSVYYVYRPISLALAGLHDWWANNGEIKGCRIILDDDVEMFGSDYLGVLLMGEDMEPLWVGNILDVEHAIMRTEYANATTLQVTATLLAGIHWVIANPHRGIVEAEDIDHNFILQRVVNLIGPIEIFHPDWPYIAGRAPTLNLLIR